MTETTETITTDLYISYLDKAHDRLLIENEDRVAIAVVHIDDMWAIGGDARIVGNWLKDASNRPTVPNAILTIQNKAEGSST